MSINNQCHLALGGAPPHERHLCLATHNYSYMVGSCQLGLPYGEKAYSHVLSLQQGPPQWNNAHVIGRKAPAIPPPTVTQHTPGHTCVCSVCVCVWHNTWHRPQLYKQRQNNITPVAYCGKGTQQEYSVTAHTNNTPTMWV